MAFDEKGKFHRLHNWTEDRLSGVNKKIQAARMDEEDDGFASGLSQIFLRDGRAKMEKELDLAGHKVTNLSVGALDNDAVNNKQLSDVLQKAQERLKKIAESFVEVETLPDKPDDSVFYFTKDKRLYKGSRRIIEVYYSTTALTPVEVLHIYKGSKMVYKAEAYDPGTVLIKQAGEYNYNIKLPKGVYKIAVSGAGGTGTTWIAGSYGMGSSGGSGAFVEIEFVNPKAQQLTIYAPPQQTNRGSKTGGDAVMTLGGVEIVRAKGGRAGTAGSGGSGGTFSVNSSSGLIEILRTDGRNGNSGGTGFSGSAGEGASVSLYDSWGTGREVNSNPGGLRVEYLRYR